MLPKQIDFITEVAGAYENLDEWADANGELVSALVLEAGEYLAKHVDEESVTILEFLYEDEVVVALDLNRSQAVDTLKINETHWVQIEDYLRAARARDAGEYIKKKGNFGNTTN